MKASKEALSELRARHEEEFNAIRGDLRERYGLPREAASKKVPQAVKIARLERKLLELRGQM